MLYLNTFELKDRRLIRRFDLICTQIATYQSAIVNQFCKKHKDKMGTYRFLNNPNVTAQGILSALTSMCTKNASDKRHLLCIQDTTEINYEAHVERMQKKTPKPGVVNQRQCGLFLHPLLVVDAPTRTPLGFSAVQLWNRSPDAPSREARNYKQQPIEEKESYRWIKSSLEGNDNLPEDAVKTIIADREADIFELFSRVPSENVHLLIRSTYERLCQLDDVRNSFALNKLMGRSPQRDEYQFEVRHGSGRKKRTAKMELRFEKVTLRAPLHRAPASKDTVTLWCIHVKEKATSVPRGETPIEWRLLTTHTVETAEQAMECIEWYRCRWLIEELFRVLKKKGFMVEDAQLETAAALEKLLLISLQAALQVMILKMSFDKQDEKLSAEICFTDKEIALLRILTRKHNGDTKLQQNPYRPRSMAWAAWTIARMGAWSGYKSQSIPGYITLKRGMERFNYQFELYEFIK